MSISDVLKAKYGELTKKPDYSSVDSYKSSMAAAVNEAAGASPYREQYKQFDNQYNQLKVDLKKFLTAADMDNSGTKRFNAAEFFEERKKQAQALKQRAATLALYMEDHADSYTPESYDYLMQTLSTFDTDVDDVLSRYQPSLDAREGLRAYEDEFLAAMKQNEELNRLDRMAAFSFDPNSYAYSSMRQGRNTEGDRGVKENWTTEQRYRLGQMQMDDPNAAREYAVAVNAGQDPYIQYQQQEQQKANWLAMDLEAERREIDRLRAELDTHNQTDFDFTSSASRKAFDQESRRLEQEISAREQQYNLAKREQESAQFKAAANRSDFTARSGYANSGFEMPTYVEDADPDELVYEYINNPDVRSQINQQTNALAAKGYDLLEQEEVGIYNYYYATEGPVKAQQYLDNIQDTLNQRMGERGAEAKKGDLWKQLMAGAMSGYSNAVTAPQYFFDKDSEYINTSPFQYMSAAIREDLADTGPVLPGVPGGASLGQMAYDLVNTTANMGPSILLSTAAGAINPVLGKVVGAATMGSSAAGGSYQQALNAGYSKDQARAYAALSGASEIGLEYLLGGISKLGGEIPERVLKQMVSGIDNAIAKAAITVGGSMVSEGFEEGLQEVINPWIENLTLYADKDVDWNEVAYSTLLGALSGGVMEGPSVVSNEIRSARINKLMELAAQKVDADIAAANMTAEQIEAMKPTSSESGNARLISKNMPVDVQEFAEVKDGKATVKLKDGTAEYQDISFGTEKQGNQFFAVESLPLIDTENANKLLRTIQDADVGKDTMEVVAIREAYRLGYMGAKGTELRNSDAKILDPKLQDAIYAIGKQQRTDNDLVRAAARAMKTEPTKGYKKVTIEGKLRNLKGEAGKKRKAEIAYIDRIADTFSGTAVHVYESYKRNGKIYFKDNSGKEQLAPNGKYVNGEIWLDLNSGDNQEGLVLNTFAHEMYHHIEEWNKPKARELAEFVVKELGLESADKAVAAQIEKARAAGYGEDHFVGMTKEQAWNEVYMRAMSDFVADSLETMFTRGDPAKAIANLKNENRSLFDKIREFIDEWVSKVREFYSDKTISQEGAMVAQLKNFEQLQQLFMEAMQGAKENYLATVSENQVEQTDVDLEAQHSIRNTRKMTLQEQLSAYYKGKFRLSDSFYFGETPNILARSGLDTLSIAFGQDDFKKSTVEKHNIPRRVLKNLNMNLKKPIFSFTHGKQAVIAIDDIDGDGKPVVVAIHGGHNMDRKPVNLMKSIYGLNNPKEWIGQQIDGGGKFRIYDKEKATAFLQTHGYLAEVGETSDGSWDIITKIVPGVKPGMNSLRNQKPPTTREILSAIDISTRNKHESHMLGQYQENLSKLADLEPRLELLNAQIEELNKDQTANIKEILRLQKARRQVNYDVNRLKRLVGAFERSDMGKRLVTEVRAKARQEQSRAAMKSYKDEQKKLIKSMQTDQRLIREELTGKESDITLMEKEFIRIVKQYEKLDERTGKSRIKDANTIAQLKDDLKAEAKAHKEDSRIWEKEFNRLLKDYETADRQIERLEATIARQRATAKARVEGRRNTEMRHKIQRKVNELDHLLRHGSKHRNVPEFLQDSVAAVLQAINMEVRDGEQRRKTFEANLARYDRQIAMVTDPAKVSELIRKRNEYEAKGDQFANRMDKLQAAYQQIREENTGLELDEGIADHLNSLFETVGSTPLGQMTSVQLDAVNDILNVTMTTVRNANQLLAEERSAGVVENSKNAIQEIKSAGETKKKKTPIRKKVENFGWNNLKPVYVFDVIGSKTLTDRYNALRKGEDTLALDLNEAKTFFQDQWKKNGGKEWDMDQKWKFKSTSGKSFELDLNQIMTLYAMAKDEDARSHLRVGGFSFDSDYQTKEDINLGPVKIPVKVESTDASAYNLSDEILGEIINTLTPQQRAFADAMQAYLSDVMAAKGNEVSLKKYGIRLFKKKNYFPIRVADQFMAKARKQQAGDIDIKDSGFTKERKPEAKNPVVLSAFTEIWAEHVDEMSLYHSFVLPLDDFNRVLNYHDSFVEGEQAVSVVEAITNAFGKGATNYIDQLIKDVNGGVRGGSTVSFANNLMSKAKKAQTMASLSVAIQQPSSILRACSMIDVKYFIGRRVSEKTQDTIWAEIKKYAPIAIIKEMGGYDTNVGKSTVDYLTDTADYQGFSEKFKALFTDENFRDDALGRLPALMDEVAWSTIWNAVKREQADQHPNMDVKSDAFMKLVANRFTDVITRTQVYDSVFSRSGLMRDKKSDLAKMITSFMAEPTTTANMLAVSVLQASRGDIGKAQTAKTVGSIVTSLALNSALVSIIYAMRDDDEDKRYDEKLIENFRNYFFESLNPVTYIPYARDIYNLFIKGYDVERADMELFGDLQNAIEGLDNEKLTAWDKTENVIGAIGNLLGIPVKNILRDVKGLVKTLGYAWDDKPNLGTETGYYIAGKGMDLTDGEEMILALQRGDEEHIQRVFGRFESQQKAESALQHAIREKYVAGEMTEEEAQDLLTTAFDRDDEHEVYWILDEWDYARENGNSEGYLKYGKFFEAVDSGDYESEMDRLMVHGAEASDIRSQISRYYHKQYLEDETAREDIREKLRPVYESTGMYPDDIDAKFNDWDFETEYGMTYGEYKAEYREGNVTENELRGAMKFYGLMQYEIAEDIRSLNDEIRFVGKYDMTLSEMKDAYDNGDITRNQMTSALVFDGMTQKDAKAWIVERDIENQLGIDYAHLDDAYKHGDISRQTLYDSMIRHGATKQEADDAIVGYDWLKKHVKQYPDLTISVAKKFAVRISADYPDYTLEDFGVSIDSYIEYSRLRPDCKGVDNNGDGQADSGTKRDAIFRMIDSLPISSEAKDGLALIDYGMKSIRKNAPWH